MNAELNTPTQRSLLRSVARLFFNHMDAWCLTLMIASVALLLHNAINLQTIVLMLVFTAGYWLGFALNDYFDAPFDAHDAGKAARNFFVKYHLSTWQIVVLGLLVLAIAVIVFAPFGWKGAFIVALALFIMWAYSAPPLRLKSRPLLDLLTHALFVQTFPYFAFLVLIGATWLPVDVVILFILFLSSMAAQLEQQARDYEVDSKTDSNFTTRFGLPLTLRLLKVINATFMGTILLNAAIGTFPAYLLPFGIVGLPVILHRFTRRFGTPRSEKLVFISVIIGMLYMGFIWSSRFTP
jgi:4-hydroxybenzoate polyprenyltransferase